MLVQQMFLLHILFRVCFTHLCYLQYLLSELVLYITSFLCIWTELQMIFLFSGISELQQRVCIEDACSQKQLGSQLKEEPRKPRFYMLHILEFRKEGKLTVLYYFALGRWVCIQWRRIRACVSGWSLRWMSQHTEHAPSSQILAVDKSGTNITRETKLHHVTLNDYLVILENRSVSQWLYTVCVCCFIMF